MFTSKSMRIGLDDTFYLEDVIEGYTTIDVTGRESIERTVSSDEVGVRDGSIYKYKKYGTRTLTVSFVIEGADSTELLSKLDELNSYLDEEEKEFIFDDEPDKFYRGTVDGQPEISIATPGGSDFGVATGSFNILCSDPFKYAVEETIIPFDIAEENASSTAIVEYSGTHPAYPTYEAFMFSKKNVWDMDTEDGIADLYYADDNAIVETVDTDNDVTSTNYDYTKANTSYISFFDEDGHILQFGDPGADISNSYQQCDGSLEYDGDYVYYTASLNDDGVYKFKTASITEEMYNLDPTLYYLKLKPDQTLTDKSFKSTSGVSLDSTVWKINALNANGINLPDHRDNQNPSMSSQYYKSSSTVSYSDDPAYKKSKLLTSSNYKKGKVVSKYPTMYYNLKVVVVSRDRTSVKLRFTVSRYKGKGAITKKSKVAMTGYILDSAGNTLKTKQLKSSSTAYSKAAKTLSSVSFADFSISGISASTQSLSLKFAVSSTKKGSATNIGALAATSFKVTIPTYASPAANSYFYGPSVGTYGIPATNQTSVWHGPTLMNILPADDSGARGAKRFNMSYHINMRTTNNAELAKKQHGQFVCYLIGGSGVSSGVIQNPKLLAAMLITKTNDSNTTGTFSARVRTTSSATSLTTLSSTKTLDLKYGTVSYSVKKSKKKHKRYNYNIPCSISKTTSSLKFTVDNQSITYTIKSTSHLKNAKIYGVAFGFFQRWTDPAFSWLGIRDFKFTKKYCDTKVKTVNPFGISDILTVNTGSGDVLLNGVDSQALGALGNDWEKMVLTPGINQYNAYCSMNDKAAIPKVRRRCRGYAYIRCEEDKYENDEQYYILGSTYTPARGHDRVVESAEGYSLPVPSGGQSVSVLNVGGKSVVKNQLVENGNFEDASGWTREISTFTVANNVCSITRVQQGFGISKDMAFNPNHKYLILFDAKSNDVGEVRVRKPVNVRVGDLTSSFVKYSLITTTLSDATRLQLQSQAANVYSFDVKNVQTVDLTTWFGAGNEPTTTSDPRMQQVYDYLATNPSYNAGSIASAEVESVDVVGFNQWDEEWENCYWNEASGGIKKADDSSIGCKDYIKVFPNTYYKFTFAHGNFYVLQYDSNKSFIKFNYGTFLDAVRLDANCHYVTFYSYNSYGTTYNHDICINISNASLNGTYSPYTHTSIAIPDGVKALDGYGWSAGSVYNEVDYANKKYIKRVGRVDLGSLSWTSRMTGDVNRFYSTNVPIPYKANGISAINANSEVGYIGVTSGSDLYSYLDTKAVGVYTYDGNSGNSGTIVYFVNKKTDATPPSGYLYYELEEPIVTDISELLDDGFLENISIEEGGTITFKQSELHLPVPSTEEYAKELAPGTLTMRGFLSNPEMFYRLVSGTYIPCSYSDWDESATYYVSSGTPITPVSITEEQYNAAYDMYFYRDIIDEYDPNRNYYLEGSTTPVAITQNAYEANPTNYFFYDEALPQFRLRFREVYV